MGAKSNVERAQDDKLRLQTFCWVGTGFSEKELDQLYQTHKDRLCESLDCLETNMSLSLVVQPATKKKVDHWLPFGPVMEVYCADLSESSDHTCSSDGAECGIAPRFPRRLRIGQTRTHGAQLLLSGSGSSTRARPRRRANHHR